MLLAEKLNRDIYDSDGEGRLSCLVLKTVKIDPVIFNSKVLYTLVPLLEF